MGTAHVDPFSTAAISGVGLNLVGTPSGALGSAPAFSSVCTSLGPVALALKLCQLQASAWACCLSATANGRVSVRLHNVFGSVPFSTSWPVHWGESRSTARWIASVEPSIVFEAARSVRNYRFFTNAFSTVSQGIDIVSTYVPLALRGNTVISAVFNYTDTQVTDNTRGLLDGQRLAEYAHALPRTRWNVGVTQRLGRASLLGRVSYYGGWYDYDSGYGEVFDPSGGLAQGFFDGRPIADVELIMDLGHGTTLAAGAQNVFDTYSQVSVNAMAWGEQYSEYMPWGYSGAYYYARVRYDWAN